MECNKASCCKKFHVSHLCTLPPKHLRKGSRLPRLITIASVVPTIIKDYDCSSLLNGKRPAKRRETKIWLIIAHSLDNFIRSELPAWKSDMAEVEIGKPRKMWHILRSWKPSQTQIYKNIMLLHWVWFEPFFIESLLFNPGMVSEVYLWWSEQTSLGDYLPWLSDLLSSDSAVYYSMSMYELHSNTSSGSAHSKSKSQTKNKPLNIRKEKTSKTIWKLHVEIIQISFHMLYHYSSHLNSAKIWFDIP